LFILCVLDHASSWYLNKGWPTRWHLLYYILLNMFQTLIRPSSGASEYLLCYVGWLEACWCYPAGLAQHVSDVNTSIFRSLQVLVLLCRLTWGVLVLCSGNVCWLMWYLSVGWTPKNFIQKFPQKISFKNLKKKNLNRVNFKICGVQPSLRYHITNRHSRYITPARLKSAYTTQQVLASSWRWTY